MANKTKPFLLSDSAAEAGHRRTVFVDTTLDTRFLLLLSLDDTVSDFKRKIEKEHVVCFSDIGDIVVHALKVKRRGQFYHLSDSMLVKDAFGLVGKNWFLSVDASVVEKERGEGRGNARGLESDDLVMGNSLVDRVVDMALDVVDDGPSERSERENEVLEKRDVLAEEEEASRIDRASKKRKRKMKEAGLDEDLQEGNIGSGREIFGGAMMSQTPLGNSKGLTVIRMDDDHQVADGSDTCKRKKIKKSKRKPDQVISDDDVLYSKKDVLGKVNEITPESGVISTIQKHSGTIREFEDQEILGLDTQHKIDETEREKERKRFGPDKVATSKDHLPFDVESNPSLVIKETNDQEMGIVVSGDKGIVSTQVNIIEAREAVSKKNDSRSNDLDSTFRGETKAKAKDADVASDVDKRERHKKTKGLGENVLSKSGEPDVQNQVGETNIFREPLGGKCVDEKATNEESNLSPTSGKEAPKEDNGSTLVADEDRDVTGIEVRTVENKEKIGNVVEKPLRKLRKSQKSSATNLPDEQIKAQDEDVIHQNQTPSTVTETEVVASSKPKKGKVGKLKLTNSGVQNDTVTSEPESKNGKSTELQLLSLNHGEKNSVASSKRKKGKVGKLELTNSGVQNDSVASEPESKNGKSTELQLLPLNHGEKNSGADLTDDVRHGNDKTEAKTPSPSKTKTSKDHLPVDVESTPRLATKQPEDLQPVPQQGALSKKNESTRIQSNNMVDGKGSEVKTKDDVVTANPVDENRTVVVPIESSKKRKKDKKTKVLGKKLLTQSDGQEAESLGVKTDSVPTNINVEEEPVKKKRNSPVKNFPAKQVEPREEVRPNPTVSKKKVGVLKQIKDQLHGEKVESQNFSTQDDSIAAEPKSATAKSNDVALSRLIVDEKRVPVKAKKAKNGGTSSVQTSSNVQSSLKSNGKQRITENSPIVNSTPIPVQESLLLVEKSAESTVHPEKKVPQALNKTPAKASIPNETRSQNGVKDSGKITKTPAVSNPRVVSQSALSNKRQLGSLFTPTNAKAVTQNSIPDKSLVNTSGSIFRDDSDASSDDNEGSGDSNASTKTPSDYSSDYSDGEESNANSKSLQKGSYTSDNPKSTGRRTLKSCTSAGKDFTFDSIIRSSSTYKKAKTTATELQLNEESQQVDFVPDSQPIQ